MIVPVLEAVGPFLGVAGVATIASSFLIRRGWLGFGRSVKSEVLAFRVHLAGHGVVMGAALLAMFKSALLHDTFATAVFALGAAMLVGTWAMLGVVRENSGAGVPPERG